MAEVRAAECCLSFGVVCVSTPSTSAPFPLLFPLFRPPFLPSSLDNPLASPLLLHPRPASHPSFLSLSLLSFTLTSLLLLTLPSSQRSKTSYGKGDMQSHNPRSNRPDWRMALVARELARYKSDIATLSETRFSEQGQLEEVGAGYTFFWSDWPKAEPRDSCVAFAIQNDIVGRQPCLP
ncbi:unnamed protein product [Schistocephalus solidus]|uniref:Uncharacterized protein n=1 Tax=Schistocephalus solidus TaxID=70667 RepID=A0A183SDV6_SCHSO|nr:unnamed protein product [Schistocephalus solidus]